MKVSFFHLGAAYAYIEPYLRSLRLDVVVPPFSSRRTLDLGTRFCPEMICVPCKLIFGNYVEALEAGADNLFPALKRDIHIPILSLSFNEQTSHTGLMTRLEAFVAGCGATSNQGGRAAFHEPDP